jgi:hypothetical protein
MTDSAPQEGTVLTEFKYRFKEDKLGNKRDAVQIVVPTISLQMISKLALATAPGVNEKGEPIKDASGNQIEVPAKVAELIKEAVDAVYQDQIRSIVNEKEDISQANFPMDQATWEYIASMDRTSRRGAGISKETWDGFAEDYCKVMPAVTGKSAEAVAQAAQIFVRKFRDVTGNLGVVEKLQTYLSMYMEAPGNKSEEFLDVLEFLGKKAKDLLSAKDKAAALANL